MATASEAAAVATESSWIRRVQYYRLAAAVAIMNEDPQTANHAARVEYATKVINGQDNLTDYALGVATNTTIRDAIDVNTGEPDWGVTDSAMEGTVNGLFNAFAGIAT